MKLSKQFIKWLKTIGKTKRQKNIDLRYEEIKKKAAERALKKISAGSGITTATTIKSQYDYYISSKKIRFEDDIKIDGRRLLKEIDELRERLLLLERDAKLEEKYPRLKEKRDEYQQELEKYRTFERLK